MRFTIQTKARLNLMFLLTLTFSYATYRLVGALNTEQLLQMQNALLEIYNRFIANASSLNFAELMDERLVQDTNRLIMLVRGWSTDDSSVNIRETVHYLSFYAISMCLQYADALFDEYCALGNADANVVLQATQIYQIRTNWLWDRVPSHPSTCFEIQQFLQRGIGVKRIDNPPYVQLFLSHTGRARFSFELIEFDAPTFTHYDIQPPPERPRKNVRVELEVLTRTQNVVLEWYRNRNTHASFAHMSERNEAFYNSLQEIIRHFFHERNVNGSIVTPTMQWIITSVIVLRRCVEFTFAEYYRHRCHPAHREWKHTLNPRVIARLTRNHESLTRAYQYLRTRLQFIVGEDEDLLRAFSAHLSHFPFQVVYAQYSPDMRSIRPRLVALHPQNQTASND